jgi:hypothetical protein
MIILIYRRALGLAPKMAARKIPGSGNWEIFSINKKEIMYFILEDVHNSFYTEAIANDEFPSLQAAGKKLQALRELKPEGKYFIVTRLQA